MTAPDQPQLYLVTPPAFDPAGFRDRLARVMDARPVACLRLSMAATDADSVARAADLLREACHARDVPVVIDTHLRLVTRHGLDGVHLQDGARSVRKARDELGRDAIVGAFCGASRHDGMTAGEAGADYIAFGPVTDTGLGAGQVAGRDLFAWWSEMIELPVVAEGGLTPAAVEELLPVADFLAIGPEIWSADDPLEALNRLWPPA